MRVLLVVAHEKKESLTWTLAQHVAAQCAQQEKIDVTILDLYAHASEIPFFYHDKSKLEASTFFKMNRDLILNSDRLALFFPVYWYSTPGIMKCWIDLITNYAWKYTGGRYAQPIHPIKKALIVSSTMSPRWYTLLLRNPAQNQVVQTLYWMGINNVATLEVGSTSRLESDRLERIKKKLNLHCQNLLAK